MFNLAIMFTNGQGWRFLFKSREKADAVHSAFIWRQQERQFPLQDATTLTAAPASETILIEDDYAQKAAVRLSTVAGVLLQDMDKEGEMAIECAMHQARTQARGNIKMQSDPTIRSGNIVAGDASRINGPMRFS